MYLVIFSCMPDTENYVLLLGAKYFCIPENVLQLCYEMLKLLETMILLGLACKLW